MKSQEKNILSFAFSDFYKMSRELESFSFLLRIWSSFLLNNSWFNNEGVFNNRWPFAFFWKKRRKEKWLLVYHHHQQKFMNHAILYAATEIWTLLLSIEILIFNHFISLLLIMRDKQKAKQRKKKGDRKKEKEKERKSQ